MDGDDKPPPSQVVSSAANAAGYHDDVSLLSQDNPSVISRVTSGISSVIFYPVGYLLGTSGTSDKTKTIESEIEITPEKQQDEVADDVVPLKKPAIDFLLDSHRDMTWGRRIALSLIPQKWYNPHADNINIVRTESLNRSVLQESRPATITREEKPSLEKAWAYFEHFALPRYLLDDKSTSGDLSKAEPGEGDIPTKLYSPLFTPLSQMGDFGLGIGLYFSTLRALAMLTFLCGLLNIPNFIYFSGQEYSNGQPGVPDLLKGSAICTNEIWVPCIACSKDNFTFSEQRFATATNSNGDLLTFAKRNDCDGATFQQVMINYGTLLLVLVGIVVINRYQKKKEIEFDEDEQTTQDCKFVRFLYRVSLLICLLIKVWFNHVKLTSPSILKNAIDSVRILNPPHDAVDADEWFKFFYENFEGAHATSITIALDNDLLVRALVARREAMKKIELHVEPGTSLDTLTLARLSAETSRKRNVLGRFFASLSPGIPEYFCKIAELEAQIKGWAQIEYPVSNVFVSFETEAAQRRVLSALSLGSIDVSRNNSRALSNPQHMFRRGHDDERVLKVKEPDEPSSIRWADLNVKFKDKMKPLITTSIASVLAIALIAFLISVLNDTSAVWAALGISISNSVFPMVAKALTSLERHSSEGLKQTSLYFKIAAFRWVNTAFVITVITPFTVTITNKGGLIPQIYAIFFAELVTTNAIQLLDPVGHLQRHYLAPRANTQDLVRLSIVVAWFLNEFLISFLFHR